MNHPLACSYDAPLVVLSVAIAVLASYVVLELAERVTTSQGISRLGWLAGGTVVMGTGIWAMHFIGMLAYKVAIPVQYNTWIVLGSVLPAIFASAFALFLVSRPKVTLLRLLGGSVLMGLGIAAMHYSGMLAMQIPGTALHYNWLTVGVSVAIAIAAAFVALSITFRMRGETNTFRGWQRVGGAVLMGSAVPMMHYMGMAAVTIAAVDAPTSLHPVATKDSFLLAIAVGFGTLIIISLTLLISFLDRRLVAKILDAQILQDSQDTLQNILHGVRVGVLVIGPNLEIQLANHAVLELLGLTEQELQDSWQNCLAAHNNTTHLDQYLPNLETIHSVLAAIATQPSLQNAVIECVHPKQHCKRWLLVNAVPECSLSGKEQKIICTFSDVTDLKQAERALQASEAENRALAELAEAKSQELSQTLAELQQAQSQIVHQEKMSSLGQMVAGVAHEINNPVTFIYSNLTHADQYLQELLHLVRLFRNNPQAITADIQYTIEAIDLDFILEDLPKLFRSMQLGADRIREIVSSLRTFSRLDEAAVKAVDLHEGIDSTLMILGHRLKALPDRPAIQVIKDYNHLPLTECYAGQLNQVFMNVLSNAVDALEDGLKHPRHHQNGASHGEPAPQIRIHTEFLPAKSCIQIRIADNGPGILEATRQKIFDPFYTTKPVGKGTGLGLFISYQIVVERHNGSFQCLSQPGQGTEFAIEIPVHHPKAVPASLSKKIEQDLQRSQSLSRI